MITSNNNLAGQKRWKPPPWSTAMFLLGALFATLSVPGNAHELRPAIATITTQDNITLDVTLSLNLEAALAGIGPEHSDTSQSQAAPTYERLRSLRPAALEDAFRRQESSFLNWIDLKLAGVPAKLRVREVSIPKVGSSALPRISEVKLAAPLPSEAHDLTWRLAPVLGDSVVRFFSPDLGEAIRAEFVRSGETSGTLTLEGIRPQSWGEVFRQYFKIGFVHIVPKGLDHILFLVGLFLLSTRLSTLLWQITAFTAAHTLTLALAISGTFSLPSAVVEPLIALSIAWVAIENLLTDRLSRWRPIVVFCFGLLHGLGFAGVLGEIGLTPGHFVTGLLAFNIGVEAGQLAVIALCFLAVGWFMGRTWYRSTVMVPGSLAIAVVAFWWAAERLSLTDVI